MKDFLKKEIKVGDKVVTNCKHYEDLMLGEVVKLTPKMLQISCIKCSTERYIGLTFRRFPSQVIVINKLYDKTKDNY